MPRPGIVGWLTMALLCACGRPRIERPAGSGDVLARLTWQNDPRGADDVVVARVDGRPVYASDVSALARERKLDREAALAAAIDAEVLAGAAQAAGLTPGDEVRRVLRQHMVHKFITDEFERRHRPEHLPEASLRTLYERNKGTFVHPRAVRFLQLTFRDDKNPQTARKAAAELRAYVDKVLADVKATDARLARFSAIADEEAWKSRGLGIFSSVVDSPVLPWAAEVLALRTPGELKGPIEGANGSHVIVMMETEFPARNDSFEVMRAQLASLYYQRWVTENFQKFANELSASRGAVIFEEAWKALVLRQ